MASEIATCVCTENSYSACLQVHNAGAQFDQYSQSKQGHEITFATNHLGPVLLTQLLLPNLATPGG